MRQLRVIAFVGFGLALFCHLWFIHAFPFNFSMDGDQRWAGRDHVLVQAWLPATQALIWATVKLGGGLLTVRAVLSVVASLGVGAATWFAGRVGGPRAAWVVVAFASFGPFTDWTSVLYQEGTFLCVLGFGLALAGAGRLRAADLVMALLGLVRYEAWPYLLVYLGWRRRPEAAVALLGVAFWLLIHLALGMHGATPSPIGIDDWDGLADRFDLGRWLGDLASLGDLAWRTGGVVWLLGGLAGIAVGWRQPWIRLLAALLATQVAVNLCWMAGLEMAIARMLVVPCFLGALCMAIGLGPWWERLSGPRLVLAVVLGLGLVAYGVGNTWTLGEKELRFFAPERAALPELLGCPSCRWWVEPRVGFGTRDRHDGCEAFQGLTDLHGGEDFQCSRWIQEDQQAAVKAQTDRSLVWNGKRYVVEGGPDSVPAAQIR